MPRLLLPLLVVAPAVALRASLLAPRSSVRALPPAMSAVLRCKDVKTQADVVLVGAMHYNPASIELARSAVQPRSGNGQGSWRCESPSRAIVRAGVHLLLKK